MKFKAALLGLLALVSSAHAQVQPRPIFASSIYNGAGIFYIPTTTPLGHRVATFDNNNTITYSVTTDLELTYLSGATSNIQAQINALGAGAVLDVFGRSGHVTAQLGDYSAFFLQKSLNLSDLASPSVARTNLGLGTAATQNTTAFDAAGAAAAAQAAAQAASDPLGSASAVQALALLKANNLSDLLSASTARTNLGLGSAATQNVTAFLQPANNLSEISNAATARTNLGLGSAATQPTSAFDASGAATAAQAASLQKGANLSDLVSAATARTNLGLGSAATQPSSAFDASGAAAAAQAAAIAASDTAGAAAIVQAASLQKSANLSDLVSAATARTNLGLGSAATQASSAFDASGAAAAAQAASLQKSLNLSDLLSAATARTNLGLGSAATHASTDFDAAGAAAAAQAAAQAASDPSGTAATVQAASLQKTANLSDLASASVARANLGLGSAAVQPTSAFQAPLTFSSSLVNVANTVTLVNDAPSPGNFQVYGTDGFGLKGWFPASGAFPGTGTVTNVTVVTANGFSGSVLHSTTTPQITLSTTVAAGLLKSDGISALVAAVSADVIAALGYTPENTANKGVANGYAGLDGAGKVLVSELPSAVMQYEGAWNPNTNTPSLSDGTGTNGNVYYVTAARSGTVTGLTDPSMTNFQIGDLVIYTTAVGKWQLVSPANGVQSVNGLQGVVTLTQGNLTDAGTDGISITGGSSAVWGAGTTLSQHVADTTHSGYLSSADWNTFSGKQSALTFSSSLVNSSGTVTLVNDSASPGNNMCYATGPTGTKGWISCPSGSSGGGGGTGGAVRFNANGGVTLQTNIDAPYPASAAFTLTTIYMALGDTGSSGTTTIQVNQWRSGILANSATASVASGNGVFYGTNAILSGTLTILSGDVITVDIIAAAGGAQDLSAIISSTIMGGPTGPTGANGGFFDWKMTGGVSVMDSYDSPFTANAAFNLGTVYAALSNSGTSGSTNFQLRQFRAGSIVQTVTGSISASSGNPISQTVTLSNTLAIAAGDVVLADVTGVAGGVPQDLSVIIASANMAGPQGPAGGTNALFELTGAVVPFTDIGQHVQNSTQSLTVINIGMRNSGTSGSTVVQLNQYRSGSLLNSATASVSASSGSPIAQVGVALSGTLSLQSGDLVTCDVNSVAGGAPEHLTVEY